MKDIYILAFNGTNPSFKGQLLKNTENNDFKQCPILGEVVFDAEINNFKQCILPRIVKMLGCDAIQEIPCLVVYPAGSKWKSVFGAYKVNEKNNAQLICDEVKKIFTEGLQDYDVLTSDQIHWNEENQIIVDGSLEFGNFFEYVLLGHVKLISTDVERASCKSDTTEDLVGENDAAQSEAPVLIRPSKEKLANERSDVDAMLYSASCKGMEKALSFNSMDQKEDNFLNVGSFRRKQYDRKVIQRYLRKKTKNHVTTLASHD